MILFFFTVGFPQRVHTKMIWIFKDATNNMEMYWPGGSYLVLKRNPMATGGFCSEFHRSS